METPERIEDKTLRTMILRDGTRVHFVEGKLYFRRVPEDGLLVFPAAERDEQEFYAST
jgi:hypothetical protein